jgi:hypothetical protein
MRNSGACARKRDHGAVSNTPANEARRSTAARRMGVFIQE